MVFCWVGRLVLLFPSALSQRPRRFRILWVVIRRETEAYDAAASLVCDDHLPELVAWKGRSVGTDHFGRRSNGLLARMGITGEDRSVLVLDILAVVNIEEISGHGTPSSW